MMKRMTAGLLACIVLAAMGWLAHGVWGQAVEPKERTVTMTVSQWKEYLNQEIAKAIADREKNNRGIGPVTDEQVRSPENWHRAIFNHAEYVVYTGPGQAIFHHFPEPVKTPPTKAGAAPSTAGPVGN